MKGFCLESGSGTLYRVQIPLRPVVLLACGSLTNRLPSAVPSGRRMGARDMSDKVRCW